MPPPTHSTTLTINLHAIRHNVAYFRSQLAPNTRLMVMVKAFAYGSSLLEVARALEDCGVDYLAVAYADEGAILREAGVALPIMVTNPMPNTLATLLKYQLEPVLYSLNLARALIDFVNKQHLSISAHIKLETGMHRLGLEASDIETLLQILADQPYIRLQSIYSHLAAVELPQQDVYTQHQVALFQQIANRIQDHLQISLTQHILNTTGIFRFPQYQFDMVRLGIGLHGVGVDPAIQPFLQVVSTLRTVIAQIKVLPDGATVGYRRKGVARSSMKIATLAIGYADGFSRALGNGRGKVWLHGQLAPVVGDVCMDMTMIDITDIHAQEGDEVIIFGRELSIGYVAQLAGTIAYEFLTNVGERVRRICYTPCESLVNA
ncbi:MAG: alanine racemase [Bacteroidota bacterium]